MSGRILYHPYATMITMAFIEQVGGWWNELTFAKQLFYGIGLLASLAAVVLAVLTFIGMEHHDVTDAVGGFDHGGGGIFSIKPLTGFFLGFGWAGGIALDQGLSLLAALATALGAGGGLMVVVIGMIRAIYSVRSDGTARISDAVGAVGTVYVTLPAAKAQGGQITVTYSGRQHTVAALSAAEQPVPSGEKVKVVDVVDSRTLLVEKL